MRRTAFWFLAGAAGWLICPAAARADGLRLALVIGNGDYSAMAPVPGCLASAQAVGGALRHAGFDVVERNNLSNGEMGGAIASYVGQLGANPLSTAVVYVCGYAAAYNGRLFLLPATASLLRTSDVLTQGLLAASISSGLARAGTRAGLLLLDGMTTPGAVAQPGEDADAISALTQAAGATTVATAVALEANPQPVVTPFARAITGALAAPRIGVDAFVQTLRQVTDTAANDVRVWVQAAQAPVELIPPPAAAPTVNPPATAPVAPPAAPMAAPPAPPLAAPPVAPAPSAVPGLPDEASMSEADRRRAQALLGQLGYYGGRVDGVFGGDTRAAIKRFQHEIGAPMTGRLGAADAARLAAAH